MGSQLLQNRFGGGITRLRFFDHGKVEFLEENHLQLLRGTDQELLTGQLIDLHLQSRQFLAEFRVEMGQRITDDVLETFAVVAEPKDVGAEIARRYGDMLDTWVATFQPTNADTRSAMFAATRA